MVQRVQKKSSHTKLMNDAVSYGQLRTTLSKKGIFERAYWYYLLVSLFTFAGLFFSAYQIFITPVSLLLVLWCLVMAFFTVQFGGLVHDAGHRAIATSPKMNDFFGHIYASVIAFGYSFWKPYHDQHHAHPNEEDEDPDLDLPLHGFTKRQFAKQKGIWKVLRKYQVYIFFPLRSLVTYTYRLDNLRYFKKEKRMSILWWKVIVWAGGM